MAEDWLSQTLLFLTGTADSKLAAERMAARELVGWGRHPSVFEIAERHNVLPLIREMAHGPSGSVGTLNGSYVISLNSNENEARRRFTLAHEIGHILIAEASGRQLHETSGIKAERLLDEFASRVLLPDYLLADWLSARRDFSIKILEDGTKDLQVSMMVLVKRIGQTQLLDNVEKGIIVGSVAVSRRAKSEPALRVNQVACPSWGFLPMNRRFSSIGLQGAAEIFERQATTGVMNGLAKIQVKRLPSYRWTALSTSLEYKIYRVRTTGERFMLLVIEWPRPSDAIEGQKPRLQPN